MNEIIYHPTKDSTIDLKGNIATIIGIALAFTIIAYGISLITK